MSDWGTIEHLIDGGRLSRLVRVLAVLDEPARRGLAPAFREFERRARDEWRVRGEWEHLSRWGPGLVLVACGVLTPSAAAPVVARTWLGVPDATSLGGMVLQVLTDRQVGWIPDLASRLAARLRIAEGPGGQFRLIQVLVDGTGMPPPPDPGYAVQWFTAAVESGDPERLRHEVGRGPEWVEVMMLALDTPGSGSLLTWGETAGTVASGTAPLVGRDRLLDICLSRLQRGGRRGDLDGLRALHDALAPSAKECAAHAADYLALLPGSHSTVAGLALRQLRRAEEAGPLSLGQMRAAGEAVLVRPEKGLVRAQLSWLDEVAGRPGSAGVAVQTAALAFGHTQASDLQQRALTVVLRHRGKLSGIERDRVVEAARDLPSDLRAQALAGLDVAEPAIEVAPSQPVGAAIPRHAPVPILAIESPAELAEKLAALLGARYEDPFDPGTVERILCALVEFAWSDRAALGEALHPIISRDAWIDAVPRSEARLSKSGTGRAYDELLAAVGASVAPPDPSRRGKRWPRARSNGAREGLTRVFAARLSEIATGLTEAPIPCLLATPTSVDGSLDPAALCARLDRLAAAGAQPWPRDLAQSLLRLPPGPHPALAQRIAGLSLPQARALAEDLSGPGVLATITPAVRVELTTSSECWPRVTWVVDDGADPRSVSSWPAEWQDVLRLDQPLRGWHDEEPSWRTLWPSMLPGQPDLVGAYLLPELSDLQENGRQYAAPLPLLADSPGPFGPATLLAISCALSAATAEARAAALDALITLLSGSRIDPAWFGTTLGELARLNAVMLSRIVPRLRDVGPAVGWPQVWQVTAAALTVILPLAGDLTVQRLGDLLALAVEAADRIPHGELRPHPSDISGLAPIAARPGKSRLVTEARRLQHLHSR
ncbi:MAG: hypothetical protein QG671_558 [Actinomycetota bacterium]|nr:hypothetical protein [Actinomycetota bacterium]